MKGLRYKTDLKVLYHKDLSKMKRDFNTNGHKHGWISSVIMWCVSLCGWPSLWMAIQVPLLYPYCVHFASLLNAIIEMFFVHQRPLSHRQSNQVYLFRSSMLVNGWISDYPSSPFRFSSPSKKETFFFFHMFRPKHEGSEVFLCKRTQDHLHLVAQRCNMSHKSRSILLLQKRAKMWDTLYVAFKGLVYLFRKKWKVQHREDITIWSI